jgi:hypothetical protein
MGRKQKVYLKRYSVIQLFSYTVFNESTTVAYPCAVSPINLFLDFVLMLFILLNSFKTNAARFSNYCKICFIFHFIVFPKYIRFILHINFIGRSKDNLAKTSIYHLLITDRLPYNYFS